MGERIDFVRGDATGLQIPAHPDALIAAGPEFLTQALRAFGTIPPDNAVTAVSVTPCPGGSTGKKLFLTLDYAQAQPQLERTIFAKFSRDFDDERRDWQHTEMAGEAKFVALSRGSQFPIRVPKGYFADYHEASGTGLVITECITYGEQGIEPHRRKCLDWQTMADPLPYYRASVTALARLAGTHKSGALAGNIEQQFPFDPVAASADPFRSSVAEQAAQLQQARDFAHDCPQLMPEEIRDPAFIDRLESDIWLIRENEAVIRHFLVANPALISLNHWNAHIDNCWFWREGGELNCGLIDWGRVGQLTFGSVLWGGLSAAHHDVWDHHLDDVLLHFLGEYRSHGGPPVTLAALKQHLFVHMAVMGVARMFAAPEIIRFRLTECVRASGPRDPMFTPVSADPARTYLSIYTALLKTWQREDFGRLVREVIT